MKRLLAVAIILAVGVTAAVAQTPQTPVNLAFATLDTGSAWYVYGATMASCCASRSRPARTST
jgi:hypothetical protein